MAAPDRLEVGVVAGDGQEERFDVEQRGDGHRTAPGGGDAAARPGAKPRKRADGC